jgi:hypothetical protein
MNSLIHLAGRLGLFRPDLDYHLLRGSMVLIFALFGYQKWFEYEAQTLIPYIGNGPLLFWLYPAFGIRGASTFPSDCCCSPASGIARPAFSGRSARPPRLSAPSPSSRSCPTAGRPRRAAFPQW